MLDRFNNKIYLQYKRNDISRGIAAIIISGFGCFTFYNNIIAENYKLKVFNIFFQSKFLIVLFIIICITVFIGGVMNILFPNDIDYHIDLNIKKLVLIQGKKPFIKNISIDFCQIKEINLLKTKKQIEITDTRYKTVDNYIIEIYDNNLNAYSCYDDMDVNKIIEIANELSIIFNVKIMDRTDCIDYEGFRQRVI
jgi:hypothetical protein